MLTVEDDSMDSKYVDKVNQAIAAILENKMAPTHKQSAV